MNNLNEQRSQKAHYWKRVEAAILQMAKAKDKGVKRSLSREAESCRMEYKRLRDRLKDYADEVSPVPQTVGEMAALNKKCAA